MENRMSEAKTENQKQGGLCETEKSDPSVRSSELVRPPARLWLQWHGDSEPTDSPISVMDVTWSREQIWPYDVEYARVPNDAFIAPLMQWLVQREGKCAATTMSILKRKLDRYIETSNYDEWRKLPNAEL
jgi:hypothetical protein